MPPTKHLTLLLVLTVGGWACAPDEGDASADDLPAPTYQLPVTLSFSPDGRMYVAEKAGRVIMADAVDANDTEVVVDISDEVYDYGDHGLTSATYHDGYVYVTFMTGRTAGECEEGHDFADETFVPSCPSYGQLDRFVVGDDGSLSAREQVVGGVDDPVFCTEYYSHGLNNVFVAPEGRLLVAAGDGAGFFAADVGGDDGDPCGSDGAFRSQDPDHMMGKMLELDPDTGTLEVFASGFRNPTRQTSLDGIIYSTDTGYYQWEEINTIEPGGNYGWPCWEAAVPQWDYSDVAAERCETAPNDPPLYAYAWQEPASAITALAAHDGQLYYADYAQGFVKRMDRDGTNQELVVENMAVVDLQVAPDGALYALDIVAGTVTEVSPIELDTTPAASGQEAFANNCAACHGPSGEGMRGPSLQGITERLDAGELRTTVADGRTGMPAFGEILSDDELDAVLEHLGRL